MSLEYITFYRICNGCGVIKKGITQDLELVKDTTISHKCGGIFEYAGTEMPTVETEPIITMPGHKSKSIEAKTAFTSDIPEINLAAIKKIDAVFECDKCRALIKIAGDNIEKATKLTAPHNECRNPIKGTYKFLTIVGKAVASSGQYSIKK